jgi:hypothetical protein
MPSSRFACCTVVGYESYDWNRLNELWQIVLLRDRLDVSAPSSYRVRCYKATWLALCLCVQAPLGLEFLSHVSGNVRERVPIFFSVTFGVQQQLKVQSCDDYFVKPPIAK